MPTALADDDVWVDAPDGPATGEPRTSALIRAYLGKINKRARWIFNRLTDILGSFKLIENVNPTTDRITITGHGIASNTVVRVYSVGGSVPGNLSAFVAYYVIVVDADTIKLSATSGPGSAVDITSAGTGSLHLFLVPDATANIMTTAVSVGGTTVPAATLKSILGICFTALGGTFNGPVSLDNTAGRLLYDPARTITRVQSTPLWNNDTMTLSPSLLNVAAGEVAYQKLDRLPDGATLTQINFYHNRNNTGTLPTTRVTAELFKTRITTGVNSSVAGPTEDPTSTLAPYEAFHTFSLSGLSEVINNEEFSYYVEFTGEDGSNTTFTLLYPVSCTFDVEEQDEAP